MTGSSHHVIVILGATASGKGALARALAGRIGGEIVSMDSMKVYRGMDIGTAKPTPAQRSELPHHLIDVADPWESFSAARWVEAADEAIAAIHARGRPAVVVGGTMLYFKCFYEGLFEGPSADPEFRRQLQQRAASEGFDALHAELARVDPEAATRIHRQDYRRIERALEVYHQTGRPITLLQQQWDAQRRRRPEWDWQIVALRWDKEVSNRRCNERVRRMIAAGLEDEARRLWSDPRGLSGVARQAVGYAEWFEHFQGRRTRADAIERIKIHTRRLAKHQRTWLRRIPDLRWLDLHEGDTADSALSRLSLEDLG